MSLIWGKDEGKDEEPGPNESRFLRGLYVLGTLGIIMALVALGMGWIRKES